MSLSQGIIIFIAFISSLHPHKTPWGNAPFFGKFYKASAQRAPLNCTRISLEFSEFHQNFARISLELYWNFTRFYSNFTSLPVPFGQVPFGRFQLLGYPDLPFCLDRICTTIVIFELFNEGPQSSICEDGGWGGDGFGSSRGEIHDLDCPGCLICNYWFPRLKYHWTEKYYIIISETIFDLKIYITFSKMNTKWLMWCNLGVPTTGQATRHTPPRN